MWVVPGVFRDGSRVLENSGKEAGVVVRVRLLLLAGGGDEGFSFTVVYDHGGTLFLGWFVTKQIGTF